MRQINRSMRFQATIIAITLSPVLLVEHIAYHAAFLSKAKEVIRESIKRWYEH